MLVSNQEEKHTSHILPLVLALLALLLVQGALVVPIVVDDEHVCLHNTKQFLRIAVKGQGVFRHLVPLSPGGSADLHTAFVYRVNDAAANGSAVGDQAPLPPAAPATVDAARAPPTAAFSRILTVVNRQA